MSNNSELSIIDDKSIDSVKVRGAFLKAALLLAGVNDIRFYLNYVFIERGEFGTVLAVSDGHRLGCAQLDDKPAPHGRYWFPRKPISSTIISKSEKYDIVFTGEHSAYIHTEYCDIRSTSEALKFPDISHVIPKRLDKSKSIANQVYHIKYLQDAENFIFQFLDLNKNNGCTIMINGESDVSSGVMLSSNESDHDKVFVIVMPKRGGEHNKGEWIAPDWSKTPRKHEIAIGNDAKA